MTHSQKTVFNSVFIVLDIKLKKNFLKITTISKTKL